MSKRRTAISDQIRQDVLTEAGYKCANPTCQTTLALDHHHIVHVSESGTNEISNLLALCPTCHSLHHRGTISDRSIAKWKERVVALNLRPRNELKDELKRKQLQTGFDPSLFPRLIREMSQIEMDVLEWAEESPQTVFPSLKVIAFGFTLSGRFRGSLNGQEFDVVCKRLRELHLIEEEQQIDSPESVFYALKTIRITPLGQALLQACRAV
jgi:hypothetical protein